MTQPAIEEVRPGLEEGTGDDANPEGAKEWRLGRSELLNLLDKSRQVPALCHHIRRNGKRLITFGMKASSIRTDKDKDIMQKYFKDMPDKPYEVIVEPWIEKTFKPELEKYLSDKDHSERTLVEYLCGVVPYLNDMTSGKPSDREDVAKRARLLISATLDAKHRPLARWIAQLKRSDAGAGGSAHDLVIDAIDDPVSVLPSEHLNKWLLMLACVASIRFGMRGQADRLSEKLLEACKDEKDLERLKEVIAGHKETDLPDDNTHAQKIRLARPREFRNLEGLEVLTRCTKVVEGSKELNKSSYAFSKVLAVKRRTSSEWRELTQDMAAALFPSEGSLIHFQGRQYPELPSMHEYAVWSVDRHDHMTRNKEEGEPFNEVHAASKVMPAQQVLSYEAGSTEVDKVLANLYDLQSSRSSADDGAVLSMADGVYIQPAEGIGAFLDSDHSRPMRAWNELEVVQLKTGIRLHVGELPDTSRRMDLSDEESLTLKAFEQAGMVDAQSRERMAMVFAGYLEEREVQGILAEMQLDGLDWELETVARFVSEVVSGDERLGKLVERRKDVLLANPDEIVQEHKERIESLDARTKEAYERIQASAKELADVDLDKEMGEVRDKHYVELGKLVRRMASPEARRSWFDGMDEGVSEFKREVSEVSKRLGERTG